VFRLNEPGFNIGGPLFIPHIYNESRKRTFFFVNEEWRRLVQGSSPSIVNTIAANNFPTAGAPFTYNVPSNGTAPIVPVTTDPAKLAIYAANGLTAGQPFPGNTIPAALLDPNAVLEMNAGTFPKPNFGASQYISSIPQPTDVCEDVVRIDHALTPKLQLMGHYLHDAVTTAFYPPLWQGATYPTVGTTMGNPSWSAIVKLTQTISPNVLNETAFLYSGNTIHLAPVALAGYSFVQPAGWTATSFFPVANNDGARLPQINLGAPYNTQWSLSYFPWKNSFEGYEPRDDFSWTKGVHQFKFGFSWLHDPKNQQLQYNTQGTAVFNNSSFSDDSYINFLLGDVSNFSQLNYLAGKHWVNNNYSFYALDNWHVMPRLTLNLGLRFDGMPHAYERYNQFANFVAADYNTGLGYPLDPDGTINPAFLTSSNGGLFYLNGIQSAGVNGFPRGVVKNYYKTWQPRVGFAYDLNGDGKTVVRGGFGMFFERVQGNDVYNAALNPPFAYIPSANNVYFSNPNTSALTGLTTSQTFPSNLNTLQYNYNPPGTAMFSLGVQRQLAPSVIAVVQYAGSTGWHQSDDRQINTLPLMDSANPANPYDLREGVANGTLNANLFRIYPGFGSIQQQENTTNFSYNAFQAGLRMDNKHNLTVQLAYTYSHAIDQVTYDLNSVTDPFNTAYDRGSGALDRRHIFNANYIYNFPFFANSSNLAERIFLSGWSISGITVAQTGIPQPLNYNGADTLGLGGNGAANRPDLVAAVSYPHTRLAWFNTSSFGAPLAPWDGGTGQGFGSAGKDKIVLPGLFNWNLALFKTIPLTPGEGANLQLRFESFNTFNHTQFQNIDNGFTDGNFGQVTSSYDARTLQLGAKLNF
jgi:hypothetical protein